MNHTHSWQWALTHLLEGERLHWKTWRDRTWIAFDDLGQLTRYTNIPVNTNNIRISSIGFFVLSRAKATIPGWAIYEPPPEAIRDEILFREFDLEDYS